MFCWNLKKGRLRPAGCFFLGDTKKKHRNPKNKVFGTPGIFLRYPKDPEYVVKNPGFPLTILLPGMGCWDHQSYSIPGGVWDSPKSLVSHQLARLSNHCRENLLLAKTNRFWLWGWGVFHLWLLGGWTKTQLKNMRNKQQIMSNWILSPMIRSENKTCLKPPPI